VLAAGSLAHALVTSIQRNRGQLAVLRTLGFRPAQVSATVAWQATALAVAALAIGIPAGLVVTRSGWKAIAHQLGLVSPSIVPTVAVVVVVLVALVFAPAVSFLPGRRAATTRPAEALRTE
jgi:putative ABC transport system permease protein